MNLTTKKTIHPQEIIVWYILPVLRKEIAMTLKNKGIPQKEIAEKMGITEAAVSQYLRNKRASNIPITQEIKKEIDKSSEEIINNKTTIIKELQRLIFLPSMQKITCSIHHQQTPTLKNCRICTTK